MKEPLKLKPDGGSIDAISGASVSSKGVVGALAELAELYGRLKPQIMEKIKA